MAGRAAGKRGFAFCRGRTPPAGRLALQHLRKAVPVAQQVCDFSTSYQALNLQQSGLPESCPTCKEKQFQERLVRPPLSPLVPFPVPLDQGLRLSDFHGPRLWQFLPSFSLIFTLKHRSWEPGVASELALPTLIPIPIQISSDAQMWRMGSQVDIPSI